MQTVCSMVGSAQALDAPASAIPAADTREALPAAVLQQLRHRAQRGRPQPARSKQQQHQQKAPSVPLPCAAMDGAELDMGACMAALDDRPTQPPADRPACRVGSAAAEDRLPAAVIAHEQAAPPPANKVGDGPADGPQTTGVFARREKRKAEAESKRRAKKAALPDGAGDLSFFMQLRKPGSAEGTAPTSRPIPAESGTADSTDSSVGTAVGEDSDARNQPQVRQRCHLASLRSHAMCSP